MPPSGSPCLWAHHVCCSSALMTLWLRTLSIVLLLLIAAPSLASAACDTPRQSVATFLDNLQPDQDQQPAQAPHLDTQDLAAGGRGQALGHPL